MLRKEKEESQNACSHRPHSTLSGRDSPGKPPLGQRKRLPIPRWIPQVTLWPIPLSYPVRVRSIESEPSRILYNGVLERRCLRGDRRGSISWDMGVWGWAALEAIIGT